ncbi:DUF1365 domain-containing protein [Coraliomargarita sp. SDUM461003]|uniref:DUF1365 domain-containing protein n=1 Tax=Thalassobacterium maritimum TaxID=3041265 RepID=A0ABU1APN7_9BACT|nr:DUF1365 domain-containing protein [Coraliomargarita sp. SDUM461003]MDQ8206116.1 DUF1365 domain-containing protein [Coraliomargarita sp. SDUM461003]
MIQHSQIYRGQVVHQRLTPCAHSFSYPTTFFGFDLNELKPLTQQISLFGHPQARPLTLRDKDYLYGKDAPILEQLNHILPPERPGERTLLISSPRYFGYAFNPVNFHLRMAGDALLSVVAEVNNTFGDRHIYPLTQLQEVGTHQWTARCAKDFHVSPFNDLAGEYHFNFRIERESIFLGVDLHRQGKCVLKTWIHGKAKPITNAAIWKHALLKPFDTALNSMPRILYQAAQLYYKKKLAVHARPSPQSKQTLIDRDQTQQHPIV